MAKFYRQKLSFVHMLNHYFKCFLLFFGVFVCGNSLAQDSLRYTVTFPNAEHHECEISLLLLDFPRQPIHIVMSNSSPGRYANHFFAKNVYGLAAYSVEDKPLTIQRIEPNEWVVEPIKGYLKLNYTLFANYPDGTYSGVDRQFAHFNMPSAFLWIRGMEDKPIKIDFEYHPNKKWQVATQLKQLSENTYFAPDLDYFLDSPTILANYDSREFSIKDGNREKTIKVIFNPDTDDVSEDLFVGMTQKVVEEQRAIFGELPDFDFGEFSFLCSYSPAYRGDGMEHRNSTMVTSSHTLPGSEIDRMGTISHEFFHCWNVERLRPQSIEPFDFTKPNVCPELWFAEGFTNYFGPLTLFRAGVYDTTRFLNSLSGMLNYVLNSPGTGKFSPVEMSEMAPFTDASSFIDQSNFHNIFTSYYNYGAMIGLALDLELRTQFEDITLDKYMNLLWKIYGKKETPYTNSDLEKALAQLTGDEVFATSFFDKHIYGTDIPKFDALLQKAGFGFKIMDTAKSDLFNARFEIVDDKLIYQSTPLEKTTFYVAGLNRGDEIISMNNRTFETVEELNEYFGNLSIGNAIKIRFKHFGEEIETITVVKPLRIYLIVDLSKKGIQLTKEQLELQKDWLNSKVKI